MEVLLARDDVNHLVELVLLPSLGGTSDVTRDVDVGAVLLPENRLAHLVLFEVDDERALGLLGDADGLELGDGGRLAGVRDLRLARVDVEVDVETTVRLLVLDDRQVAELLPQPDGLLVTCGEKSK